MISLRSNGKRGTSKKEKDEKKPNSSKEPRTHLDLTRLKNLQEEEVQACVEWRLLKFNLDFSL